MSGQQHTRAKMKRALARKAAEGWTYEELATHYGAVVIPARVRKPKDKAKVESAVLVVQRWILAVLRHILKNQELLILLQKMKNSVY